VTPRPRVVVTAFPVLEGVAAGGEERLLQRLGLEPPLQLLHLLEHEQPPAVENADPVGEDLGLVQVVGAQQDRRVVRAVVGYGIGAFALLQIIEPVMHGLHWPEAVLSYCVVALGLGFPVVVCLAWIFDVNSGHLERTPPSPSIARRGWIAPLLIGVGVLAAAPGLIYYFLVRRPPPVPVAAQEAAGPSIAVLPLLNLSHDPDQDYFADGLAEELLDLLAKVPGLHVAARTSAFSFKGKNEDVRSIAAKLQVSTILEGSVRKAGEQVRITTQLISAVNGYHLWSETYDRKLTDVFAVQDEIAKAVVGALKLKLLPAQFTQDADRVRRFIPEAKAASALNHPNIITIYDVGAGNSTSYLSMELVDGKSLRETLNEGPMPLRKVVNIAAQLAGEDGSRSHGPSRHFPPCPGIPHLTPALSAPRGRRGSRAAHRFIRGLRKE